MRDDGKITPGNAARVTVQNVDVVKVMFRPGALPMEGAELERRIEQAAINAIIRHFGKWKLAYTFRVDVLEFAHAPPYKTKYHRLLQAGKLSRLS